METKPFSTEWVEGFISEACDMGFSQEQAQALLKTASMMELSKDPSFAEGFTHTMQKSGFNVPAGDWARTLGTTPWGMALGLAAPIATYGAYKTLRPHWNMSPEQQMLYNQLDDANPGDYGQIASNWTNMRQDADLAKADNLRKMFRGRMGGAGGSYPSYMSPYMF